MTMLMLLSLMTYARLETYRSSEIFQILFTHYMEKDERGYINEMAEKLYVKTKVSTKPGKPGAKRTDASPRIGLGLLKDKKQRESKPQQWQQTQVLLKNLINVLYADQPFFLNLLQEHPYFVDELIASLTNAVDDSKVPLNKTADLANITFKDQMLDEAFYKMLHGAPHKELLENPDQSSRVEDGTKNEVENDQDVDQLAQEADEFRSPEGYFSLLDFITFSSSGKIRIFLAPQEVLQAIFDPSIVDDILIERKGLYQEAVNGTDPKELESRFKDQFDRRRDPAIDSAFLDFSVTKTNPKSYE